MKVLGYLFLIGGFLAGAFATALDVESTRWGLFLPAAGVAALGLVAIRKSARGAARSESVLSANREILQSSVDRIIRGIEAIAAERASMPTDDLRHEIDARLRDDLRQFADARQSMVHLFGMQTYADIMSEFAAGERSTNRAWSASTDGYGDEADASLEKALARFRAAHHRLDAAVRES